MEQQEPQEHDLTLLLLERPSRCHSLGCLQDDDISSSSSASCAVT
jgi:hypothetical protein